MIVVSFDFSRDKRKREVMQMTSSVIATNMCVVVSCGVICFQCGVR